MSPTSTGVADPQIQTPPDHTQLPAEDGTFVHNFQEHPQSNLLTESLEPRLDERYPGRQYCIGADSGIYWKVANPPLDGCKAPDWFLVPGVESMLNGELRRSYVLWQEGMRPLVVIEYASGDGSEERDTTPGKGKFWVYEQCIAAPHYAIYEVAKASVELFKLDGGRYVRVSPNAAGRFPIEPLGVELGVWQGTYRGMELPWLRVWDTATGELLPTAQERAETERRRAETEQQRAEAAEGLLDDTRQLLQEECERAENERRRAEEETRNAENERRRAEDETRKAENERRRAEDEARKAEQERERAARLTEKLRSLGIDPDTA
jgi:Uma2 family endonuclease